MQSFVLISISSWFNIQTYILDKLDSSAIPEHFFTFYFKSQGDILKLRTSTDPSGLTFLGDGATTEAGFTCRPLVCSGHAALSPWRRSCAVLVRLKFLVALYDALCTSKLMLSGIWICMNCYELLNKICITIRYYMLIFKNFFGFTYRGVCVAH